MKGDPDRIRDLHRLAEIWERLGLRVLEMPGWENRGRAFDNTFEVLGCHHTGGPGDVDRLLRDGDPKRRPRPLPGPLCNVALHANGDVVLVASGRANHFGTATWPNRRSLGVEATGPQKTGPKFPNHDAYVRLAAGFCIFKGNADPRRVVRGDVGIPVHLVAAHKEVAVFENSPKLYGRKPDPDFDEPGQIVQGALAHGFSVKGSVRLIDTFRDQVHARMTSASAPGRIEEEDMTTDELLNALESDRGQKILQGVVTAALQKELRIVIQGDPNTDDGGTHPHNLRNINTAVGRIKDKLQA
jgi:N-acetylmuramoyl-L-alanine amidase